MIDKILLFGSFLYLPAFICYPCSKCFILKKMTWFYKGKMFFFHYLIGPAVLKIK